MSLLKRENWIACLFINIFLGSITSFYLGFLLNLYDKNAWYFKWYYWLFGCLCLFFPALIMILIFNVEIMVKVASKLDVPGKEIYSSIYFWILCLVIPVIGWIILFTFLIYLWIWPIFMLKKGNGEKFIK